MIFFFPKTGPFVRNLVFFNAVKTRREKVLGMQVSSVNKHQCFCTCKVNSFCEIFWFRFFRKSFLTIFNYPVKKVVALNKHFPYPSRSLHKADFLVWLRNPTLLNAVRGSQSRVCLVWGPPYISPVSSPASLSSLFNKCFLSLLVAASQWWCSSTLSAARHHCWILICGQR